MQYLSTAVAFVHKDGMYEPIRHLHASHDGQDPAGIWMQKDNLDPF